MLRSRFVPPASPAKAFSSPSAFPATSAWPSSNDAVGFSDPMWLAPHHVDEQYFGLLPTGSTEVTAEEAEEIARVFGRNGELRAERLS